MRNAMTAETAEDGNLPQALTRLGDAIHQLFGPKPEWIPDQSRTVLVDSPYTQLLDAVSGTQGIGHSVPRSRPSANIEALDLLIEIEGGFAVWQPAGADTMHRVERLQGRRWRPQDTTRIDVITARINKWVKDIHTLLTDEHRWRLTSSACPRCEKTHVYRKDCAGDTVRTDALQVTATSCTCQACRAVWPAAEFEFLATLIGCPPIAGTETA